MNRNETRTLWISVGAALFAVMLLYSYTQNKTSELNKRFGAKETVVVASRDIMAMETIDETMLQTVEQPTDFIQPGAIPNPADAVGQVALAPIIKGEQLMESKILKPGPMTGLSLQVAPGKRAVTLPVDDMRGVAKLMKPGDRIDILAAIDIGNGADKRREVKTLLQDVVILATGLQISNELPRLLETRGEENYIKNIRGDATFTNVTIEASPKEAQELVYILSTSPGSLFMTLRHPSDHEKPRMPHATVQSVLGQVSAPMLQRQVRSPSSAPKPKPKPKAKPRKKGPFIDL